MRYCSRCIMPISRPGLSLDDRGLCNACLWSIKKETIDWAAREAELFEHAAWAKSVAKGPWDCVVGVSGGKDSTWQAVYLRDRLGLKPLLAQFAGADGTALGRRNMENLTRLGFDLITVQPNPDVARRLARKSFYEYGNIVKYSEFALYATPFRVAIAYDVPMVFFGENPALEAGDNKSGPADWDATSIRFNNTLGGQSAEIWAGDGVEKRDLTLYGYPSDAELAEWGGKGIYMGYFLNWSGYENGVFAIRHGMECIDAAPAEIGNPYLHNSLDCDNAIVNSMLKQVKLGFGHATEFCCYDIRAGRISREEGVRIVQALDGRCDHRFIAAFCEWIGISTQEFRRVADSYRGPMWERADDGGWKMKNPIWEQEPPDPAIDLDALLRRIDTRRVAALGD
jgi:N-acetyl sugar amidotransferase